jgi:hypothetical protein
VASSNDRGNTWRLVLEESVRNVKDYSGFLTFLPSGTATTAVYLTPLAPDDRTGGDEDEHVKTVGIARLAADGREIDRTTVDPDSCSCCSTDIADTANGPIAVYRDHEAGEIRDISIVRHVNGRWTTPAPVYRDGWRINGCPTNGPAVAAVDRRVAVAWFTAANDQPRVHVAFSTDAGATFSAPQRVDERKGTIRVREISLAARGTALTVATASSGRSTGIPMMVPARSGT